MPMFVTFYSFKGGVGRTLALANVAALLAKDPDEPCRVLVWDFDLGAPGLEQVFKTSRKSQPGFLDCVERYLEDASLDNIEKYIQKTHIPGIDILSAGSSKRYSARLERINWANIYDKARGFLFIEAVKKQLSSITPSYDYVLIDSLTGYSDVGGICVKQLPDAVVLLFRLNQQNLAGIERVFRSLEQHNQSIETPISIVPVISPTWPFASNEEATWMSRAERAFAGRELLNISFEPKLTYGEKIIASLGSHKARITDDYRRLCGELRSLNPQDFKTTYERIPRMARNGRLDAALEEWVRLVKSRPSKSRYWMRLLDVLSTSQKRSDSAAWQKALSVIHEACQSDNAYALMLRARLNDKAEIEVASVLRDLTRAIELQPKVPSAYSYRGRKLMDVGQFKEASVDFEQALRLQTRSDSIASTISLLARCKAEMGAFEEAISCITRALSMQPGDVDYLFTKVRLLYAAGKHSEALQDLENLISRVPSSHASILLAHVLSAAGRFSESAKLLEGEEAGPDGMTPSGIVNIAEAWLGVDPARTRLLLTKKTVAAPAYADVAAALNAIASILLGDKDGEQESLARLHSAKVAPPEQWLTWELQGLLTWMKVEPKRKERIEAVVDKLRALLHVKKSSKGNMTDGHVLSTV